MATRLRSKSFQRNQFLGIVAVFVLFALFFSLYQYGREKEYKVDIMRSRLQMYSYEMLQTLGDSICAPNAFYSYVHTHNVEGLRVTIIDLDGRVIIDSRQRDAGKLQNHRNRKEVQQALQTGSGYDLKRASESTKETYFYSATKVGNRIIRIAIPYSAQLTESLKADNTYLLYAVILTILLGIVLYYNTSRVGRHISYLREFAVKAENGEELDHELERRLPDDELGEISHTIIALYWKLRHSEEDKQRIKRQLTQNAAHELKTPAASIHGYLESILENPEMSDEKKQHFLERCYAQSERMSKLLLDMAALTKLDEMEGGVSEENRFLGKEGKTVDVVTVINAVLDDTALELQEKGITPHVVLPQNVVIPGDQSLVYGIFRNLVDNVIAYATGADKLNIVCTECENQEKKGYLFKFSDNGQGVEPQHLEHLFERFYRVDKGRSRKLGGTGLGMAIVKNAIVAHGGTVTAENTPGGGLTIRFTLSC